MNLIENSYVIDNNVTKMKGKRWIQKNYNAYKVMNMQILSEVEYDVLIM